MAFIYAPPPTYEEILRQCHQWVSRLYRVKIVCTTDNGRGSVATTTIGTHFGAPESCPKCGGPMRSGGIAMESTYTGSSDFPGGEVVTMHEGGPGRLVECGRKCVDCGHSEA